VADDPSPTTLATESWLPVHVRPWFADRPIDKITPADVRRWQAHSEPCSNITGSGGMNRHGFDAASL
jgi:hypothetical protein